MDLVLGGARSGKSAFAVREAGRDERVLFVATAEPGDEEMRRRIARHRRDRPAGWDTIEAPREPVEAVRAALDGHHAVLLDCVTLWVSNLLLDFGDGEDVDGGAPARILERVDALAGLAHGSPARWLIVSGEVGSGVVPATRRGRRFRDVLGWANQRLAAGADRVYRLTAGIPVELRALGGRPVDPGPPDAAAGRPDEETEG